MTQPTTRILRYFDARGRAQFIRYYARARDLDIVDERVPLDPDFATWRAMRSDRSRVGPFQKLPVLVWGERVVAETRAIYTFLQEASGDAEMLGEQRLRHDMLVSSLYDDIMVQIGLLLWSDIAFPGADRASVAKRTFERLQAHLAVLSQTLSEWEWVDEACERAVTLADCLLWEELDVAQHVFGERLGLAEQPYLLRCYRELAAADTCRRVLEERPSPVTARPAEAEAIARLRLLIG